MSEERMTVVCEKGVLTFDGEVVELFGFGRQDFSIRVHVARLEKIQVNIPGGRWSDPFVSFKSRGMKIEGHASFTDEEAASPDLTALIESVRAAAPNLEG